MSLRLKLALLLGIFCAFMIASVVSATWCIAVYLDAAVSDFRRAVFLTYALEDIGSEVRASGGAGFARETTGGWRSVLEELPAAGVNAEMVDALGDRLESLGSLSAGNEAQAVTGEIERLVYEIRAELSAARRSEYDRAEAIQSLVLGILTVNIVVGCVLVVLAFVSVQRWITRPILRLGEAAAHFAAGRLDYRVPVHGQDELGQLCSQVNAMAGALSDTQKRLLEQEREAAFGEMARAVAHNMRNPLASIRACAQSSVLHLTKDPEANEQCNRIIDIVDNCERWIRNVLLVNRPVEAELGETPLGPLVERVVETSRPYAERRQVTLRTRIPKLPPGAADAQLFEQALAVIVGNAIEASPSGEVVRVEAHHENGAGGSVVIDVIDRGGGVPSEIGSKIFEPYFTTKPTGTGIGLHFARRILRAHHGDLLLIEDGPENETCFRICVPVCGNGRTPNWPAS